MKIYFFFFFLQIFVIESSAQKNYFEGRVVDKATRHTLPFVNIKYNNSNYVSDEKGYFLIKINNSQLIDSTFSFSFVGYTNAKFKLQPNTNILIELDKDSSIISEVVVSTRGKRIIEMAIDKIKDNYPNKEFELNGYLRIDHFKKTKHYYRSDALLKILMPPYADKSKAKIKVVSNIVNSKFYNNGLYSDSVSSYNGYLITRRDIILTKPEFLEKKNLSKFTYFLRETRTYKNRITYFIDFFYFSKEAKQDYAELNGSLLIDSVTYAIVDAALEYKTIKEEGFLPTVDRKIKTVYENIEGKWFLKSINTSQISLHKRDSVFTNSQFIALKYDSVKKENFFYNDLVQLNQTIQSVNKKTDAHQIEKLDSIIHALENNGSILRLEFPIHTDSLQLSRKRIPLFPNLQRYLRNNNYRFLLQFSNLPFSVSNLPNSQVKSIKPIAENYIGFLGQFRIYGDLFFEIEGGTNFGIGGMLSRINNYSLSQNIFVNAKRRPICFAANVGYSNIKIGDTNKVSYYSQDGIILGLSTSIEITHVIEPYLRVVYNKCVNQKDFNYLVVKYNHLQLGIGLKINFN